MNKTFLIGRLTKDLELRYTQSGENHANATGLPSHASIGSTSQTDSQ